MSSDLLWDQVSQSDPFPLMSLASLTSKLSLATALEKCRPHEAIILLTPPINFGREWTERFDKWSASDTSFRRFCGRHDRALYHGGELRVSNLIVTRSHIFSRFTLYRFHR